MAKFDFVVLLLSLVFALALAHVLSRVAALLLARERVRFSALLTLAIVNAVLQVYENWLVMWDYRDLPQWDLYTITSCFLMSVMAFFVCAAAVPEVEAGQPVDMGAFYWKNYRLYYGLWLLLLLTYVAISVPLARATPQLAIEEAASNLPFAVPCLLAIAVKAPWAQWLAGIGLLILSVAWPLVFTSTLH